MTKWDRLLVQLDKVFGFENRARSTVSSPLRKCGDLAGLKLPVSASAQSQVFPL